MTLPYDLLSMALRDPALDVMNFLNEIANDFPNAVSFAPGRPNERFFDVEGSLNYLRAFVEFSAKKSSRTYGDIFDSLGQYGRTNGIIGELLANYLANDESIIVSPQDIVVTVGCQEALCICLTSLCSDPGDVLLVIEPAYIGITGAAKLLGIEIKAIKSGKNGLDVVDLQGAVRQLKDAGKRPKLLYINPDYANPTGYSLSQADRDYLVSLAKNEEFLILEDHAYGYFSYDGERLPALKCGKESENVIYVSSFSKSLFPGLRMGLIVADQKFAVSDRWVRLADELSKAKSLFTVNTSPLMQAIVAGVLLRHDCSLKKLVTERREFYKGNLDVLLDSLGRCFPREEKWTSGIEWNHPKGGFFLTVKLPFAVGKADLQESASEYGVLWTPMSFFYLSESGETEVRLSFSSLAQEQVRDGVRRFAAFVKNRIFEKMR